MKDPLPSWSWHSSPRLPCFPETPCCHVEASVLPQIVPEPRSLPDCAEFFSACAWPLSAQPGALRSLWQSPSPGSTVWFNFRRPGAFGPPDSGEHVGTAVSDASSGLTSEPPGLLERAQALPSGISPSALGQG